MIAVESTRHHADCTVAVCVKTKLRYTLYTAWQHSLSARNLNSKIKFKSNSYML